MFVWLSSFFDGSASGYLLAGVIGCISFPVICLFGFGLIWFIAKSLDYLRYLKKRKQVFDELYPQYQEMMKGEEDERDS